MRIGILIGETAGPATLGELRDHAHGMTDVWCPQALGWDAFTALTVAGLREPHARLGTAVIPVRQRHPLTLAAQALSVQAATGNRLTLGIGVGVAMMVTGMYGLPADRPVAFMREYLAGLLPLLRGEPVAVAGDFLTIAGTVDVPGAEPPAVLLAALGPAMLRLAGSSTDGVVTWMTGPRALSEHVVPLVTAASAKPPRIVAGLPVCVTADADGARDRIAARFGLAAQVPEYRRVLDIEGAGGAPDVALIGDEETVSRGLKRLAEAGVTEFAAAPFGTAEEKRRTLELLRAPASGHDDACSTPAR
ncbi:TIGR03564 family F420-dependent LLM class oxidoreductase [Actinoplanes couchii]|uniref:LLM class F420-dependent oxidoreductase n=1 Tax=Actinoplanes couchii TaxID=403638 RepID=A0ABQ3XU57_9ACTN|nr:TIGR03564 family F420-dependent LLM class oxidoreductase [Actinoplanes couchii]MDR6319403.1 F420-dependent oxidoreductase-like protein [Actinoplanes couchii]GID62053.1 LLM class F420-dependent oxidoreductase [Actinoplanes couchii]